LLEEKYGSKNMLLMIMATALITGLLNIAFFNTGLLGASGVVFMLILLSSFVNLEKGKIPATFILVVIVFIGREVRDGILMHDNISRITHIMGGMFGAFAGCLLNRDKLDMNILFKPKKKVDLAKTAEGAADGAAEA
jgi:GlpG protein